jgi:hypothetical protein
MKKFVLITFVIVIVALLIRNADVYANIIKTVTDLFGKSFRAVTDIGETK